MKNLILILSDNVPFATSLKRAFTGAPFAENLRGEEVVCASTAEEVQSIAKAATVDLVLLDASLFGGKGMDGLIEWMNQGTPPVEVRYILFCWEVPDHPTDEAFTLYYPFRLTTLAQAIKTAWETPASEWLARQQTAHKRQRLKAFCEAFRPIWHDYSSAANIRIQLLGELEQLKTPQQQLEQFCAIVHSGTEGLLWAGEFVNKFATLDQYPDLTADAPLQALCDGTQTALQGLFMFASNLLTEALHPTPIGEIAKQYSAAMEKVQAELDRLKAHLFQEVAG